MKTLAGVLILLLSWTPAFAESFACIAGDQPKSSNFGDVIDGFQAFASAVIGSHAHEDNAKATNRLNDERELTCLYSYELERQQKIATFKLKNESLKLFNSKLESFLIDYGRLGNSVENCNLGKNPSMSSLENCQSAINGQIQLAEDLSASLAGLLTLSAQSSEIEVLATLTNRLDKIHEALMDQRSNIRARQISLAVDQLNTKLKTAGEMGTLKGKCLKLSLQSDLNFSNYKAAIALAKIKGDPYRFEKISAQIRKYALESQELMILCEQSLETNVQSKIQQQVSALKSLTQNQNEQSLLTAGCVWVLRAPPSNIDAMEVAKSCQTYLQGAPVTETLKWKLHSYLRERALQ